MRDLVISTTSALRAGSEVKPQGQTASHQPYKSPSGAPSAVSLEGSESRVEPEAWRLQSGEKAEGSGEDASGERSEPAVPRRAGRSCAG